MPGSGMDTPSPWRQGPDWEAINITAMEKRILVKERDKKVETNDNQKDCKRALMGEVRNSRSFDNKEKNEK